MKSWEKRLGDLAYHLKTCADTYFDPELFRMNTNTFLTTARTVTFIIQKGKREIPDFDDWYQTHVVSSWATDRVMTWAKDSRNQIEKIGDLELHSSLDVRVVYSYLESEDSVIPQSGEELIESNLVALQRAVVRAIPPHLHEGATIRIERQWRVDTLPDFELLSALTYVYSRVRQVVADLCQHTGTRLSDRTPSVSSVDPVATDARKTRYLPLEGGSSYRVVAWESDIDPLFEPPDTVKAAQERFVAAGKPASLEGLVDQFAELARSVYEHDGHHQPLVLIVGESWQVISIISIQFPDRASKLIFWRAFGDRILALRPRGILWIAEAWERSGTPTERKAISDMPIVGENLHVFGLDVEGARVVRAWQIRRSPEGGNPILEPDDASRFSSPDVQPNFIAPIEAAFAKIRESARSGL